MHEMTLPRMTRQQNKRSLSVGCLWGCAVLLFLPAGALADPRQGGVFQRAEPAAHHKDATRDVHYKYQYAVDDPVSGVVNDRWEQRNGDFVKGQYSLLDPDGKVRTVDYEVDGERGFHAVVRTQYPAPSLLSIQSASQVQEVYQDAPVNIRAKNGIGIPEFALRNPRFSLRDNLPFNYHALDAAKVGINTEEDGGQLQLLEDEGPLSPKEAQRRKYHRENHLLPHERLLQYDFQDQAVQQDTRLDLQDPSYNALGLEEPSRDLYSSSGSVFNPRAAYISLRPRPPQLSPAPAPNPPPAGRGVSRPVPHPQPATAAEVGAVDAVPSYLFRPRPLASPAGLHTLAIFPAAYSRTIPAGTSARAAVAASGPAKAGSAPRHRVVQHITETSPGLSASRSYYLR